MAGVFHPSRSAVRGWRARLAVPGDKRVARVVPAERRPRLFTANAKQSRPRRASDPAYKARRRQRDAQAASPAGKRRGGPTSLPLASLEMARPGTPASASAAASRAAFIGVVTPIPHPDVHQTVHLRPIWYIPAQCH